MRHPFLFKKTRCLFLCVFVFGLIVGSVGLSDFSWLVGSKGRITSIYNADDSASKQDPEVHAEQDTAKYTLWLAVGTFVLAVAGLLQIYFLSRTDVTARSAASAAERAAKAAEDSILKADDTARRELRAYITVEPNGIDNFLSNNTIATVRIVNAGRIPARNVRWIIYDAIEANKLRDRFDVIDKNMEPSTNLLGPGANMLRFHECAITEKQGRAFFNGNFAIYIWGKVIYQDGFGVERWTCFCHRYEKDCLNRNNISVIPPNRVRQHQYGNGTDEDND